MLSQCTPEGEKLVQYLCRQVTLGEWKHATIEIEALEAKLATETLRYCLWGAPFTVVTDCVPLVWLKQMKELTLDWPDGIWPFSHMHKTLLRAG